MDVVGAELDDLLAEFESSTLISAAKTKNAEVNSTSAGKGLAKSAGTKTSSLSQGVPRRLGGAKAEPSITATAQKPVPVNVTHKQAEPVR